MARMVSQNFTSSEYEYIKYFIYTSPEVKIILFNVICFFCNNCFKFFYKTLVI